MTVVTRATGRPSMAQSRRWRPLCNRLRPRCRIRGSQIGDVSSVGRPTSAPAAHHPMHQLSELLSAKGLAQEALETVGLH